MLEPMSSTIIMKRSPISVRFVETRIKRSAEKRQELRSSSSRISSTMRGSDRAKSDSSIPLLNTILSLSSFSMLILMVSIHF